MGPGRGVVGRCGPARRGMRGFPGRVPEERVVLRIPGSEFARIGRVLEHLAATSYGVHGQAKFVRAPASQGSVVITSHSARLLGSHLQLSPGVGRVLLKLVEAQRRSHGDGGLTVVAFAAKILRKSAAEIHHAGMDVHKLIDEISSAMDALEEFPVAVV